MPGQRPARLANSFTWEVSVGPAAQHRAIREAILFHAKTRNREEKRRGILSREAVCHSASEGCVGSSEASQTSDWISTSSGGIESPPPFNGWPQPGDSPTSLTDLPASRELPGL